MAKPIYFDNHATTPLLPQVLEAMMPYLTEHFGNPMSGTHAFGWKAQSAITNARERIAKTLNANANEIVFTSGATESIHLAVLGLLEERGKKSHIISSPTEHKCVIEVCKRAEKLGHEVSWLKVNRYGEIDLDELKKLIRPGETALISLMHANNEVGTIHPIKEIGAIAKAAGVSFHVDAAQTFGRLELNVREMNIDLISLSAHKFYGPKGAGALFVRQTSPRVHLAPWIAGGGQENGMRGGTHNVAGIVGMGAAAAIAAEERISEVARLTQLRDHMIKRLTTGEAGIELNGHPINRLCNNVNISVENVSPDAILLALHNVAFSTASACSSANAEPSHVLTAMGRIGLKQVTTLRFGLGRDSSLAEVDQVCDQLLTAVTNARKNSRV